MSCRAHGQLAAAFLCVSLATGCGSSAGSSGSTGGGGSNSGGGSGGTALASGGAKSLYVAQLPSDGSAASVLQFSIVPGSISGPTATLIMPPAFQLTSVATDSAGQIYAGGYVIQTVPIGEVLVYAAGATGSATPLRTLTGIGGNGFYGPVSMFVDASSNLFLLNGIGNQTVSVYASNASGAATPARQISGVLTQIALNAFGITVDKAGTIYVANKGNTGQILAFAPGATGNVAPTRVIAGDAATLNTLYGMDTDSAGNLYVGSFTAGANSHAAILKFSPAASGNVAPINTIVGSATGLYEVEGLRVDAVGNIYAAGTTNTYSGLPPALQAFAPSASGNVAPAFTLSSSAWNSPGYYFQLALK